MNDQNNLNQQPVQPTPTPAPEAPVTPVAPVPQVDPNAQPQSTPVVPGPLDGSVGGVVPSEPNYMSAGEPLPQKKSKKGLIIGLVVVILAIGGFLAWKLLGGKELSPAEVYTTSIDTLSKNINETLSVVHNKTTFNAKVTFETDNEDFKAFNGQYSLVTGFDADKKAIDASLDIIDSAENEMGGQIIYSDGELFLKLSNNDNLYRLGALESEYVEEFDAMFDEVSTMISDNDFTYLVTKTAELLKSGIDTSKVVSKDATIKINGEEVKTTANVYELDNDGLAALAKTIIEGLVNDDKACGLLVSYLGEDYTVEDIREAIKDADYSELFAEDEKLTFTIYTYGKNSETVGYSVKIDEEEIYYYTKDGNFVISVDDELKVTGKKDGEKTNVDIKFSDQTVASLVINSWTDEKIDLTFDIMGMVTGSVLVNSTVTENTESLDATIKVNYDGSQYTLTVNAGVDYTKDVPSINTSTAIEMDEEFNESLTKLAETLLQSPLYEAISAVTESINDYDYDYDYDDDYDWEYDEDDYDWDDDDYNYDYDDEDWDW